jgi:hypothetical protein
VKQTFTTGGKGSEVTVHRRIRSSDADRSGAVGRSSRMDFPLPVIRKSSHHTAVNIRAAKATSTSSRHDAPWLDSPACRVCAPGSLSMQAYSGPFKVAQFSGGLARLTSMRACADTPDRPAIAFNRWSEDWSVLAETRCSRRGDSVVSPDGNSARSLVPGVGCAAHSGCRYAPHRRAFGHARSPDDVSSPIQQSRPGAHAGFAPES